MKRLLFATAAIAGLALAAPGLAQTELPETAPVTAPDAMPDPDQDLGAMPAPAEAQAQTEAMTAEANASAEANQAVTAQTAEAPLTAPGALAAMPANAAAVCEARTVALDFGARTAGLNLENRNTIEYSVDAASVCQLETVTIADSAEGALSTRRTAAVRAALIERGVPEDRITIAESSPQGGDLEIQMTFAGAAQAGEQTASLTTADSF